MTGKTPLQKMLLKPGQRVLLFQPPPDWAALLGKLPEGAQVVEERSQPADAVIAFFENGAQLQAHLAALRDQVKPGGLLWVAYHKGTSKVKTDTHRDSINAYAKTLGLRGIAIIAIDDDWAALRLMPA